MAFAEGAYAEDIYYVSSFGSIRYAFPITLGELDMFLTPILEAGAQWNHIRYVDETYAWGVGFQLVVGVRAYFPIGNE